MWNLQPRLRGYVVAVIAAAVLATGAAAAVTPWRARDAILYGCLLGFGAVTVEAVRRIGEPAGASRDAHGVWMLAVAVLLPPFYALAAPVLTMALSQWRVRRTIPHRRAFSAAAAGLSGGAASAAFHAAWHGPAPLPGAQPGLLAWGLLVAAAAVLRWAGSTALVLTAVRLDEPGTRIRALLRGRGSLGHDVAEACAGVLTASAGALGPVLLIFALPCGILLQRSARREQLLHASRTDPVTGLLSPVTWQREAVVQIARAVRTRGPLSVAIVHVDSFAAVAENHGRTTAALMLGEAARILVGGTGDRDIPGRFREAEFTLLLWQADPAEAVRIAERLRARLGDITIPARGPAPESRVTVSIGVAALSDTIGDLTELLAAADAALHRARRDGPGAVRLA